LKLTVDESHDLLKGGAAEEVLGWALENFGDRVAIASSFGAEDVVLVDMAVRAAPGVRVFTLDTGRLHQETYDLMDVIRRRYGVKIEVCFPDRERVREITELHGPNPFYENAELRRLCCTVRKVNPLMEKLRELDAWVCGLRQEQSVTRASARKVERDGASGLVKVSPLADWSTSDVWDYIKKNNVPYNRLHDRGFPSIGCAPCTRAVGMCEDIRAGRWWWEDPIQKECGLHGDKPH
jgi:phosphoadenosine phosphosulfate reductase